MSGRKATFTPSKEISMLPVRLRRCWELDFDWELIPDKKLKEAIKSTAASLGMPALAVLAGYLIIISFAMSHSVIEIDKTDLVEPVLVWLSICMPTGSGKSSLWSHLTKLVEQARQKCLDTSSPVWLAGDQSFEKLGEMMSESHCKILALYDELPMFLSQMNISRGRNLCDSPQVSTFLQLYGGHRWMRKTVSGEANFVMEHTGLTVAGFTQPNVAKGLIEAPSNIEKGVCQRFLWVFPKPTPTKFDKLQAIDETFSNSIVNLMVAQWKPSKDIQRWTLSKDTSIYQKKYDEIIEDLDKLSYDDMLLSGMLSKSKMQILRVGAAIHVLFHYDNPHSIPSTITSDAIKAAIKFVDICIQHVLYVLGRKDIKDEVDDIQKKLQRESTDKQMPFISYLIIDESFCEEDTDDLEEKLSANLSLTLPGDVLYMSPLSTLKKFKNCGNKQGGLRGWKRLAADNLGVLKEKKAPRGTDKLYEFHKKPIPTDPKEKEEFALKLLQHQVSLQDYEDSFCMENITVESIQSRRTSTPKKRSTGTDEETSNTTKKKC